MVSNKQQSAALVLAAVGFWGIQTLRYRRARGLRNNNPLNIERGENWRGLAIAQNDERFAVFVDPRYGYRAAARILDSYRRRGVLTLQQIVSTWAPATENNTAAYVASVSQKTGIGAGEMVGRSDYPVLFAAMTEHENGLNPYTLAFIAEGAEWP